MSDEPGHPTVLIVYDDNDFRHCLIRNLQQKDYLILEARDAMEAPKIVIRHSRHIHLLLADDSGDSLTMAVTLKPYRPDMRVLHISTNIEPSSVLIEVSKILSPPLKQENNRQK